MPRSPAEQHMEDAARAYFANVTKGDVEGILALFADDAQLINPMTGQEGIRGKAAHCGLFISGWCRAWWITTPARPIS